MVKGSPALKVRYQGADYWFCRRDNYELFKNNPARYAPQFGAYCAMSMSMGMLEPANVRTWSLVDGRLVVQRNTKAVGLWKKDPEYFTNRIECTGLYWHFVDLVWIFLFPVMYLL